MESTRHDTGASHEDAGNQGASGTGSAADSISGFGILDVLCSTFFEACRPKRPKKKCILTTQSIRGGFYFPAASCMRQTFSTASRAALYEKLRTVKAQLRREKQEKLEMKDRLLGTTDSRHRWWLHVC